MPLFLPLLGEFILHPPTLSVVVRPQLTYKSNRSCGNAYVYTATRTLYALSLNGKAPSIFRRCTKSGVPIYALAVVGLISCITFLNANNSSSTVLGWFINLSAISLLLTYMIIFYSYICFRKAVIAQLGSTDTLPFRTPFGLQPYISWVGLVFCAVVIFFNGYYIFWPGAFNVAGFLTAYFGLPLFAIAYAGWKLWKKSKVVRPEEADIWSGKDEIDKEEADYLISQEGKPRKWYDSILDFIF
jgi:amino acid transporter